MLLGCRHTYVSVLAGDLPLRGLRIVGWLREGGKGRSGVIGSGYWMRVHAAGGMEGCLLARGVVDQECKFLRWKSVLAASRQLRRDGDDGAVGILR